MGDLGTPSPWPSAALLAPCLELPRRHQQRNDADEPESGAESHQVGEQHRGEEARGKDRREVEEPPAHAPVLEEELGGDDEGKRDRQTHGPHQGDGSPTENDDDDGFEEGEEIEDDEHPAEDSSAHQSFEDWVDQTRERLGPDFGAMAPNLECASWEALEHLQALLTPVLSRTGPRSFRYNAFLGDYRRTPFGYHLDPHQECVFQFVLHGTRTGRFWDGLILGDEDAAWIEDPNHRTKAPRRPDLEVELSPGDVVFWPGTHLHGFDTQGPSLALSLVIDRTSPQPRDQVVSSLQLATLGGQAALPPVDEAARLDPSAPLRRRPDARLRFECHDDDLVVCVCGRTFVWPDRASQGDAMDLLRALQHTDGAIPDDLTRTFSSKALERDDILGLLSTLGELGYFAATR